MGCGNSKGAVAKEPVSEQEPQELEARTITAASPGESALQRLRVAFDGIGPDADGSMSKADFTSALDKDESLGALIKEAGLNTNYKVLAQLETSKDGHITWDEFEAHLRSASVGVTEAQVREPDAIPAVKLSAKEKALRHLKTIFESLGTHEDSAVSKGDLIAALQKDGSVCALIIDAGLNSDYLGFDKSEESQDGRITWDAFVSHLESPAAREKKRINEEATVVLKDQTKDEGAVSPPCTWCCSKG